MYNIFKMIHATNNSLKVPQYKIKDVLILKLVRI